ncbi:MAG: LytR C-terminal domain-containing protein [Actinobacteria bacterium]|nr:LytR C-terminal domain-containing protein [Actinomycetota bacterium]
MQEISFRGKRLERRKRIAQVSAVVLGVFIIGFGTGWFSHVPKAVLVDGEEPVACITLAVFPKDYVPAKKSFTINVYNASRRVGMAGITAEVLGVRGFKIAEVGNYDQREISITAEIHYGNNGKNAAAFIAAYINNSKLVMDDRSDGSVDVLVGQGFEEIRTNRDANEELARPEASPSGPGC